MFLSTVQEALKRKPDIVILKLGTNDLSIIRLEVVGSKTDDLAQVLAINIKFTLKAQKTERITR